MDLFVVAHTLGWFGKALILRDYWFCWIISIAFELCEYSLQHQLNNFAECWWDHVCICLYDIPNILINILFKVDT